ncbi:hypothetical protein STPH2_2602 [Streptomyces sp. KO7888]|nr:hypothetical protein [Streptomyces sp. KO7888]
MNLCGTIAQTSKKERQRKGGDPRLRQGLNAELLQVGIPMIGQSCPPEAHICSCQPGSSVIRFRIDDPRNRIENQPHHGLRIGPCRRPCNRLSYSSRLPTIDLCCKLIQFGGKRHIHVEMPEKFGLQNHRLLRRHGPLALARIDQGWCPECGYTYRPGNSA